MSLASQQRKRGLAMCDWLLSGESSHLRIIEEVDRWLLEAARPDSFTDGDPENVLTQLQRGFESLCAVLAENGTPDAGNLPLFQFQARIDWLQKKQAAQRAAAD